MPSLVLIWQEVILSGLNFTIQLKARIANPRQRGIVGKSIPVQTLTVCDLFIFHNYFQKISLIIISGSNDFEITNLPHKAPKEYLWQMPKAPFVS
jgi:hypothetical protein